MTTNAYPRTISVEPTTRCNMRCAMCVKHAQPGAIPEADLPLSLFQSMAPELAHCERLVFGGIGEPLLHPDLPAMVAFARTRMNTPDAVIEVQSNGLLCTPELARDLAEAGLDAACFSVDNVANENGAPDAKRTLPSSGELHGGVKLQAVSAAFERLASHGVRLGMEFVLMRNNAAQLPAAIRWAAQRGASFAIVSHMLPYAAAETDQSLFNPNTDRAVALHTRWKQRAAAEGLDLRDYFAGLFKFRKTAQEKRVAALVDAMQNEAAAEGVSMRVKSLLAWDVASFPVDMEALYAEARETAAKLGVDLQLPPLMARQERTCPFIENPGVFIDSQGRAAPCHFLWHSYRCVMDGVAKEVRGRFFGDLGRESLSAIWRAEDFKAFRREASSYEYPHCSNCNAAPCSDVTGVFERDCLGVSAPCGHCPWPVGQLACLH